MLDEGNTSSEGQNHPDEKAYRLLYEALNTSPEIDIPANFAERISLEIVPVPSKSSSRVWVLVAIALGLSLIICGALLFFVYPTFFRTLTEYSGVLSFAGLLLVAVQVADYWLVQRRLTIRFSLPSA
jgi:uncharacterized protein YjeT (DUF2065 family)